MLFFGFSLAHSRKPNATCFIPAVHFTRMALSFARARAGSSRAARMAMMAITTRSSMRVKPRFLFRFTIFISYPVPRSSIDQALISGPKKAVQNLGLGELPPYFSSVTVGPGAGLKRGEDGFLRKQIGDLMGAAVGQTHIA